MPLVNVESLDKSNISLELTPKGFDLLVRELDGRDHRLLIGNLHAEIDTTTSKFLVKPGKVIVSLRKTVEADWPNLKATA